MSHLDYINQNYPIRKTNEEKQNFRDYVKESLNKKGIDPNIELTKDGKNNNIVVGDPTTAKAVFTAHYDTPARSIFPNIMIPKNRVIFYAYQFVPVIFLLVISFAFAYLVGNVIFNDMRAYAISFLVAYYGLFFGIMRVFKNKHNYNDNTSGLATLMTIIDNLAKEELENTAFIFLIMKKRVKRVQRRILKTIKKKYQISFY